MTDGIKVFMGQHTSISVGKFFSDALPIDKFYTLRSLPQFLISVILACPESFLRSRTSRKDSRLGESPEVTRQAGMTLKTNIQFLTPCDLCPMVLHFDSCNLQDFFKSVNNYPAKTPLGESATRRG
jgi:hypothetical protein